DQFTPYYKARFDDLPAQSQVIVDAVALYWHPITAAECATGSRLDINVVSAQLNRLVRQNILDKVSLPGGQRLGFQIGERFFNIWYLMRSNKRLRRKLMWLVEFLHAFYGEAQLHEAAQGLLTQPASGQLPTGPAKLLAFASAVHDANLRRRLELLALE